MARLKMRRPSPKEETAQSSATAGNPQPTEAKQPESSVPPKKENGDARKASDSKSTEARSSAKASSSQQPEAKQPESSGSNKENSNAQIDQWRQGLREHESWAKLDELAGKCIQNLPSEDSCRSVKKRAHSKETKGERLYRKMKHYRDEYNRYQKKRKESEKKAAAEPPKKDK